MEQWIKRIVLEHIDTDNFVQSLSTLTGNIDNADCSGDIDQSICTFIEMIDSVCKPLFGKTYKRG